MFCPSQWRSYFNTPLPTLRHTCAMKNRDEHRRIALPPIPEASPENAQGCTEGDAPNLDCTESTQNSADTPVAGKDRTHEEDSAHGCTAPPPQAPKKIHPDMLEQLDLLGRLERLERLAHDRMKVSASGWVARAHEEGDSVVSMAPTTKSSSLRTPTRDREHLVDGHAPPLEQDQARWASAGAAGVALQRQHHELAPASPASCTSLASMVIKIKSESVKLHAAVARYNSERQRTPADDAGVPSTPAARSRSSSPLSLWTPIPKEIPEAKDYPGPHAGRSMLDAPPWERSEPEFDLTSASAMTPLPGEHCDGEGEERKAPSWPKLEGPMEEWPLSPSLSQWPHQKAHGELTLKSFAEQRVSQRDKGAAGALSA